ncbi:MAG: NifU family protein [Coriobacteriaceae bacterium]|nr:NifU family protein [Coriobacteriaceae bacterium]
MMNRNPNKKKKDAEAAQPAADAPAEDGKIDRKMLDYVFAQIRPQLQQDGGDAAVTEIDDERGYVYVALKGACAGCPMSAITLSQGIEQVLTEYVPGVKKVLPDMENTDAFQDMEMEPVAAEEKTEEKTEEKAEEKAEN